MDDESIFGEAIRIPTRSERDSYLDRVCEGDVQKRRRIEALLVSHDQVSAGTFLNEPAASRLSANDPGLSLIGSTIGPYKLLEQLGEGGMGTVYLAEQSVPVRRRVALKIVKANLDSGQIIARFESERQALALMNHANIAKVYDAGTTAAGQPYFAMELVEGAPITTFCNSHELSIDERLQLFKKVCNAVQHAHQKGIIHRDLKPSNVLVTVQDDLPVPKVIDFGLAKATGKQLTEKTMYTAFGQVLGTLEYMSPEQADWDDQDIDTRADVYSLGVVLYELLTGSTPLDRQSLKQNPLIQVLKTIREKEPPRPSARLSTNSELLPIVSEQRRISASKLQSILRGELDWVVMKSLEKDRNRRYATVSDLASDVQRYLDNAPVEARPPSVIYKCQKFVRKNWAVTLAATLLISSLVAGIAGTSWGLYKADQALKAEAAQCGKRKGSEETSLRAIEFGFRCHQIKLHGH